MDDLALKQLKVPDLKRILADAGISVPSRLNKADLVARIQAEPDALAVFRAQHQPASAPSPAPPAATRPSPAPSPAAAPAQTASSTPPPVSAADAELEKRKARAARFGIPLIKPPPVLSEEEGKLRARAQRFGVEPATVININQKKRAAAEPVDPEELEKRRKRAERFGIKASDASS